MSTNNSKVAAKARNESVEAGIDEYIKGDLTLGGIPYSPAALKAVFSDHSAAIERADALRQQWTDQVLATRSAAARADAAYELLRSYVLSQYGKQANTVLGRFGMPVPKPKGPRTPAAKVVAAKKAEATRKVRNTMGPVQKKAHKWTIEVPVVAVTTVTPVLPSAPATTPPEPTAPTAPASTARPVG